MAGRVLITGAVGQIGSALVPALKLRHGVENAWSIPFIRLTPSIWVRLDTTNKAAIAEVKAATRRHSSTQVRTHAVTEIYHLASLLSATSEAHPDVAWDANLTSLKHVLDVSRELGVRRIFWPSSIAPLLSSCAAAFGPTTPRDNTPQHTILEPTGLYGVTKVAGELLCQYYCTRYGLDVRSLRYPGIISIETLPGGGTTDYAVAIFYEALQHRKYKCYLRPDSMLPMMCTRTSSFLRSELTLGVHTDMPDAVKATLDLMAAAPELIAVRTSYNLGAFSVTPALLAEAIKKHVKDFEISYDIDPVRQRLADSWPDSIDDSTARKEWAWSPSYDLTKMTAEILPALAKKLSVPSPI